MAHYAKLGINSKVIGVHVVDDKDCLNADGIEDEEVGRQFLERLHHWPLWKQTSYNTHYGVHVGGKTPFRGTYAGIGMTYDEDNNIFFGKSPFPSWTLNTTTAKWEAPTPKPDDDQSYTWNETTKTWDNITP
jgi:hypothetical protein